MKLQNRILGKKVLENIRVFSRRYFKFKSSTFFRKKSVKIYAPPRPEDYVAQNLEQFDYQEETYDKYVKMTRVSSSDCQNSDF